MNALIGHSGLIGSVLDQCVNADVTYQSSNIQDIKHQEFDTVYCAAPSGNRMLVNQQPDWDCQNVQHLTDCLRTVKAERFVLISSVDAVHAPNSVYGGNRLALEHFTQTQFQRCYVIRLCTLIHNTITKNLLFDIRHRRHLDRINSKMVRQYYPLSRLCQDIQTVIEHDVRVINLVSEPVADCDIIEHFCPDVKMITEFSNPYNLHSTAPFGRYVLTRSQVFEYITSYLND